MIDPGHPFSVSYEDVIDGLEERIRYGVEQPARARFIYQSAIRTYELPGTVYAITRVTGLRAGSFVEFKPRDDYTKSNNRVVWLGNTPDEGRKFEVEYTYRERPAGLTDFNPGSVVGTLVRAVAREMTLMYEQMDEAYRRAFIDCASGVALDNVVALLGLERNPPIPSEGAVTFYRKKAANRSYPIPIGTYVADESGRSFLTTEAGEVSADVEPRSLTLEGRQEDVYGVTVPIVAAKPGPEGNVNAETIVIMPTPPTGIQGVINELPVTGGKVAEPDDQLRERAKHHLERLGNATLNAIKYAVLDVDNVEGVEVADHSVDSTIPLGEVRVSYSGGDLADVQKVVEETRAAGILAIFSEITEVLVSGVFYLIPDVNTLLTTVTDFKAAVVNAIEALEIGQPLSLRRLNALAYNVGGLAEVAEAHMKANGGAIPDPFLVSRTELIRPDEAHLDILLLSGLHGVETRRVGTTNEVDLQLLIQTGVAAEFENFTLDLTVTVRARLKTAPDQPASVIGMLKGKQLTFSGDTVTLVIVDDDVVGVGFDGGIHNLALEITIAATAYPGLMAADTTLDVS